MDKTGVAADNACRTLVVVGMKDEYVIAAGHDVQVVVGAANANLLRERLAAGDATGIGAVYSFGVAGGLDPALGAGELLVASKVLVQDPGERGVEEFLPVDQTLLELILHRTARSGRLQARVGTFLGTDTEARDNSRAALHGYRETYAAAIVDNESHIAAEFAALHGLPFAAVRAVSDFVDRELPPAALVPLDKDGSPNGLAIAKSLLGRPWQIPALLATARDYTKALRSLRAFRREVGFPSPGGCT